MYTKIKIKYQQPNEKVITILRRHWLIFASNFVVTFILLIAPIPLFIFANSYFPSVLTGKFLYPLIIVFFSIYYLSIWLLFYIRFIDLYLDIWIITNIRIINIEQHGLFSRIESEHKLERIQDISTEVHGLIQTLFNFGEIHIQTAGESQRFRLKQVPQPYYVRKTISSLIDKTKQEVGSKTISPSSDYNI